MTGAWFPIFWDVNGYFVGPLQQWKIYGVVKNV